MEKSKPTVANMIAYCQGNLRYRLYYSNYLGYLMRDHIREQIDFRINSMNRECFNNGSCIKCGCQTTHLQMANKACDGDCYPRMVSKYNWQEMSMTGYMLRHTWMLREKKFIKL